MKKILIDFSSEHGSCGEPNCCDVYSDTALVKMPDGAELEFDITEGTENMFYGILGHLGYEVEEAE